MVLAAPNVARADAAMPGPSRPREARMAAGLPWAMYSGSTPGGIGRSAPVNRRPPMTVRFRRTSGYRAQSRSNASRGIHTSSVGSRAVTVAVRRDGRRRSCSGPGV